MRLKRETQGAFCVLNANAKSQTRKSMKINVICTVSSYDIMFSDVFVIASVFLHIDCIYSSGYFLLTVFNMMIPYKVFINEQPGIL